MNRAQKRRQQKLASKTAKKTAKKTTKETARNNKHGHSLDLARQHHTAGRLAEAEALYQQILQVDPQYAEAHFNLGNVLKNSGKLEEAVASYQKTLVLKPDDAHVHYNLGVTLNALNRSDEAVASYRKALTCKPGYAEAHYNLGNALQYQGDVDGATGQFELAISQQPDRPGWGIRKALLLPVIAASKEDIQARRQHLHGAIKALQTQGLTLDDPAATGATSFHLAYHNLDNRSIVEDIAKLYVTACPKLAFEAEHCRSKQGEKKGRLRIGFLSSFLRNHTIGKLLRGIIENFPRQRFEVIVFRLPGETDEISEIIDRAADKVVPLDKKLERDRELIAAEQLDVLFYYDIGMDPYTYFLSFARLAPVQAVSFGHPDTTGIANIDYFISSSLIESSGSADQYSEQLVQLSTLPTCYVRPEIPQSTFSRADFGLPEKGALYVCPQALFKLHPDFDDVVGDLLRRDPDGFLVLIDDGKGGHWKPLLIERIGRSCPDSVERVIFVAKMAYEKFMGFLSIADALLDVPTFSGGNSSLEAFAMAVPIVTWPGGFMRARVTAGCYKQMGLGELIASDGDEYVSLALKLAHDADFKSRMQADIKANSHKLYEREEVTRELEAFFFEACQASRKGELLADVEFKKGDISQFSQARLI